MKKIKVLFLSIQPALAFFLFNFFTEDLLLFKSKFAYYDDFILKNELVNYDVVIMDDGSLNKNEINLLESFIKNNKNRKLLYTSKLDSDYLSEFINLGIEGILSKRSKLEKLSEAVLAVSNGRKYFGEYIIKYANENNKIEKLSSREKEIFSLTQNHYTNKQIAEKLFLSVKTVEVHKENIKKKLNIKSLKDLYHII